MNSVKIEAPNLIEFSELSIEKKTSLSLKLIQDLPLQTFKIPEAGDLRGLSIVNDDVIWAGGTKGTIVRTENGGKNWSVSSISDIEGLDFRAVHAFNSKEACAMSVGHSQKQLARIYRTDDEGKSWQLVFSAETPDIFLNAMAFWDANHGIVLGDPIDGAFVLFKTENGGRSWERLIPHHLPLALPNEAAFAASNSCLTLQGTDHVWFATGRGPAARVFHSSDRGCNWEVKETCMKPYNDSSGIFSLAFRNENEGIAVGGDHKSSLYFLDANVLVTHDGGLHWHPQKQTSLSGLYLSSVAWISETEAIVVGGYSETLNTVSCFNRYLWAVGPGGVCARYALPIFGKD